MNGIKEWEVLAVLRCGLVLIKYVQTSPLKNCGTDKSSALKLVSIRYEIMEHPISGYLAVHRIAHRNISSADDIKSEGGGFKDSVEFYLRSSIYQS